MTYTDKYVAKKSKSHTMLFFYHQNIHSENVIATKFAIVFKIKTNFVQKHLTEMWKIICILK